MGGGGPMQTRKYKKCKAFISQIWEAVGKVYFILMVTDFSMLERVFTSQRWEAAGKGLFYSSKILFKPISLTQNNSYQKYY